MAEVDTSVESDGSGVFPNLENNISNASGVDVRSILADYEDLMKSLYRQAHGARAPEAQPSSKQLFQERSPQPQVSKGVAVRTKLEHPPPPPPYGISTEPHHTFPKAPALGSGHASSMDTASAPTTSSHDSSPQNLNASAHDTHSALLEALQDSERRSQELSQDLDIALAEKESALMDAKLTVQRLAHQMRSLVTTKGLEDVYNVMDEDCQRLRRELEMSYETAASLESRLVTLAAQQAEKAVYNDAATAVSNMAADMSLFDGISVIGRTTTGGSYTPTRDRLPSSSGISSGITAPYTPISQGTHNDTSPMGVPSPSVLDSSSILSHVSQQALSPLGITAKSEIKRLTQRMQKYIGDIAKLKKENEELRAAQRTHTIALRQSKDAARRVYASNKNSTRLQDLYDAEKDAHLQTTTQLGLVQHEAAKLHEENQRLHMEGNTMKAQIESSRAQLQEYEQIVQIEHKMGRFVRKHVPKEQSVFNITQTSLITQKAKTRPKSSGAHVNVSNISQAGSFREVLRSGGAYTKEHPTHPTHPTHRQAKPRSVSGRSQLRHEEIYQSSFHRVDSLLNELRTACVFKHPDLLPIIRNLVDHLAQERSSAAAMLQ